MSVDLSERDDADRKIQPIQLNGCNVHLIERADYRAPARARAGGFTLLEVMVAVVITAIGLLGIAKIQALAYASTGTASLRSLVAIQAVRPRRQHACRPHLLVQRIGADPDHDHGNGTTITIRRDTLSQYATAMTSNFCQSGGGGAPCTQLQMASYRFAHLGHGIEQRGHAAKLESGHDHFLPRQHARHLPRFR